MAATQKYKVNNMAKDLDKKTKEIVELLKDKGFDGKSSSSVMENTEINLVLNHYINKSEVADIAAYLASSKPTVKAETPEKAQPEKKTAEVHEEKAAKPETAEKDEKTAKAEPKAEVKPEVKETKPEVTKPEVTKPEVKPEAKPVDAPTQTASNDRANVSRPEHRDSRPNDQRPAYRDNRDGNFRRNGDRPSSYGQNGQGGQNGQNGQNGYNRPGQFGDRRGPNGNGAPNGSSNRPFEKRPFDGQRKPYGQNGSRPPYGQNAGGQMTDKQIERQINKIQREGAQLLKQEGIRPEKMEQYPRYDKNERFDKYSNIKFTKDGFVSEPAPAAQKPSKPRFQKPSAGQGMRDRDEDSQSVRQPSLKPVFDKDGRIKSRYAGERKEGASPVADSDGVVRVVDIRTSEVDLSKYDEKLDNLAEMVDGDGEKSAKPAKKKNAGGIQKGVGGRIARNEAAARDVMYSAPGGKGKKGKRRGAVTTPAEPVKKFTGPITLPDTIMISDLAAKLKITTGEVIKKLLGMGLGMDQVGANKVVDFDTAYLLADELGIAAEHEVVVSIEEKLFAEEEAKSEENLEPRSPVVVVMGHVDHGKTSLLDAIKHTNVTAGEAGGITQHIGAYKVHINDRDITFLDTPGHEAFTAMRARGAMATDIAILVVAADDGIMPQTVEAINHAKAAGVSIIVAINKIDKPGANVEAVKQNLTNYDLVPEEWGGDTICVPVSALKHQGIEELLEMVLLVADMKELKANYKCAAKGVVIEAKLDKGRGPVATVLVQAGTLHRGDMVIAGTALGRVRAMCDYTGKTVKEAGPSTPVEITGLSEAPEAGEEFRVVANERMAKELVDKRKNDAKEEEFKANAKVSLDTLFDQLSEGVKELAIIVKADVQGSAEAVKASLEKLSNEEVKVKVIHSAVGGITESDVMLASASNAIIVGFNVRPDKGALDSAERQNVDIRTYRVIYECIEEITAAINGMLAPEYKEVVLGHAQVRKTIHVPGIGFVAGSYVQDGKITRNSQIRVVRDGVVIFEDKISSLKRFKDDAKEVAQGYECGIALERFNDIKEEDILEAYIMEEVKREL